MESRLSTVKNKLSGFNAVHKHLKQELKRNRKKVERLKVNQEDYKKAILVMGWLAEQNYDKVISMFDDTISAGLKDLFSDDYEFKFEKGTRGDSTTAEFMISTKKYGGFLELSMTQGTALKQIVACIMRIIIVHLDKDIPKILILDEPFGGLNNAKHRQAGEFIKNVLHSFKIQTIVVTQSEEFAESADKLINFRDL
jgi:ABC-type molybdenum transport system ATPase subunit/photorepair protein PhrA